MWIVILIENIEKGANSYRNGSNKLFKRMQKMRKRKFKKKDRNQHLLLKDVIVHSLKAVK